MAACAGLEGGSLTLPLVGSMSGTRYISAQRTFSCESGRPSPNATITDASDQNGESVTFSLFASHRRLDYFVIGKHPVAKINTSLPLEQQLVIFKSNYLNTAVKPNFRWTEEVLEKPVSLGGKQMLFFVVKYPLPPPDVFVEHRGFLLFRNTEHIGVIQYTPPLGYRDDMPRLEAAIKDFYSQCEFYN